jgi:hypothetical protein
MDETPEVSSLVYLLATDNTNSDRLTPCQRSAKTTKALPSTLKASSVRLDMKTRL